MPPSAAEVVEGLRLPEVNGYFFGPSRVSSGRRDHLLSGYLVVLGCTHERKGMTRGGVHQRVDIAETPRHDKRAKRNTARGNVRREGR